MNAKVYALMAYTLSAKQLIAVVKWLEENCNQKTNNGALYDTFDALGVGGTLQE